MAVVLGLAAALGFGCADFLGGHASRRSPTLTVLLLVQVCGLVLAVGFVAADGLPFPPARPLAFGALAGASGATGLALFYRALATGTMSVVAPVSAVITSILPVTWGLARGERPSWVAGAGAIVAVTAVALVARAPGDRDRGVSTRPLLLALASGVAFGIAVLSFAESSRGGGFWPLVLARATALPGILLTLAVARTPMRPHPADVRASVAGGVLDVTANAALLGAFRRELTSLVAPVAALYPAATVILARVVLRESITRHQLGGLLLALAGLVLIALG